ncbi:hypothetical protein HCU64_00925 [Methylobacterium sp. C25]|uniref:DUF6894 family protein n=1 Tax=Methylobacterium sp. C25 TaxID=2721622 RepID=UPI001F384CFA|nr:hypothetical protein [Methylobacterium sp. C25]MCE4222301.1 hypothetical protein [Methylobacterium sp. C25]
MARYFFNVYDGYTARDAEGTELPDLKSAQMEAIRRSGEYIERESTRLKLGEDWTMEVTDRDGLILFRLAFSVVDSAATLDGDLEPNLD